MPGRQEGEIEPVTLAAPYPIIRVYLLIQNRLLRDTLDRLFRKRLDLRVSGPKEGEECSPVSLLDARCDVLALDFFDPAWFPKNLRRSHSELARLKLLLLGASDDCEEFLSAVRGGVTGYLSKEASAAEVVAAVRSTFRGEAVCPPKLCASLFQYVSLAPAQGSTRCHATRPKLTIRQQRLASLIANGLTNKEIATRLNLSQFTVRNHIHRIMKQVDADSRSSAVERIRSHGYQIDGNEGTLSGA